MEMNLKGGGEDVGGEGKEEMTKGWRTREGVVTENTIYT